MMYFIHRLIDQPDFLRPDQINFRYKGLDYSYILCHVNEFSFVSFVWVYLQIFYLLHASGVLVFWVWLPWCSLLSGCYTFFVCWSQSFVAKSVFLTWVLTNDLYLLIMKFDPFNSPPCFGSVLCFLVTDLAGSLVCQGRFTCAGCGMLQGYYCTVQSVWIIEKVAIYWCYWCGLAR